MRTYDLLMDMIESVEKDIFRNEISMEFNKSFCIAHPEALDSVNKANEQMKQQIVAQQAMLDFLKRKLTGEKKAN